MGLVYFFLEGAAMSPDRSDAVNLACNVMAGNVKHITRFGAETLASAVTAHVQRVRISGCDRREGSGANYFNGEM